MKMRTSVICAIFLALGITSVFLLNRWQNKRRPEKTVYIENADENSKARLAQQEARLARLTQLLYKMDRQRASAPKENKVEQSDRPKKQQIPKVDYTKYAAYHFDDTLPRQTRVSLYIDEQLDRQKRDDKWATATERLTASAVETWSESGVYLNSAKCGSKTCKATITAPDRETRDNFLGKTLSYPPFNVHGFVHIESTNDLSFEIYFSRDGHRVPELPRDPNPSF